MDYDSDIFGPEKDATLDEIAEYVSEYGLDEGLRLYREDYGLGEYSDYKGDTSIYDSPPDRPEYSVYDRDDGLDVSPPDDSADYPYSLHYEMYLSDGNIRDGWITIYHDDTDVEDAITAKESDIEYGDIAGINYG